MKPIINVESISKTYKISQRSKGFVGHIANLFVPKYEYKQAVDRISFEILSGEAVGFIGPNGAGKSTTIKMLSGILYPSNGRITVDGFSPYKQRKNYVANIGVVLGQKSQLAWDLPVIDSFELMKSIYHIPKDKYEKNLNEFIEMLDMSSFVNQPVRQLSLGQRMRADIVASLLHSPKIVFFDEPTIGLDLIAKEKIREFVKTINKENNTTILFTTHDMQDIEKVCDRLIIIDNGNIIFDNTIENIKKFYGKEKKLFIEFAEDYVIDPIENVTVINSDKFKKEFDFSTDKVSANELIYNLMQKYKINDISLVETSIEDIVKRIYEGGVPLK